MDPTSTQQSILELTQRAIALSGRAPGTMVYVVNLPAAIAAAPSAPVQAAPLRFQDEGTVVALYGQELAATAAKYASTEVRIQIGSKDLFTDGQAGAFMPFLALFPPGQPSFPIMRRVRVDTPWIFTFRNLDSGGTATPLCALSFIADRDLR